MESYLYNLLYQQEKTYWWSVARRSLVIQMWKRATGARAPARILDAGCGTGALIEDLHPYGYTAGLDVHTDALRFCKERDLKGLANGSGDALPFRKRVFDVAFCLDTVEHIPDDRRVFAELYRVLAPQGHCIITVPAFPFLWSERDVRLHHQRRYTRKELAGKLKATGFHIRKCSYFSVFYFPLLAALVMARRRGNAPPKIDTDIASVPRPLNRLFIGILAVESMLLRWFNFPFGVSLLCVAQKPVDI